MTKKQFKSLKPGDLVHLNKLCRGPDVGKCCIVVTTTYWNNNPYYPSTIVVRPIDVKDFQGKHKGELQWEEQYIKFALGQPPKEVQKPGTKNLYQVYEYMHFYHWQDDEIAGLIREINERANLREFEASFSWDASGPFITTLYLLASLSFDSDKDKVVKFLEYLLVEEYMRGTTNETH